MPDRPRERSKRLLAPSVILVAAALAGLGAQSVPVSTTDAGVCTAPERIESAYDRWVALIGRRASLSDEAFRRQASTLVSETFAVDAMAPRILEGEWQRLNPADRRRVEVALARALTDRMVDNLAGSSAAPRLTPVEQSLHRESGLVRIPYILVDPDGAWAKSVWVPENAGCLIADIRGSGDELVRGLRERAKRVRDEYSFEQMVAELGGYDFIVLEDFEGMPEGQLPVGWTWRSGDADKNKPYRVVTESGNSFLQARDRGESVILGREVRWDLNEFPYVSFRVRVWRVPPGGDERYDDLVDSAAGVYFTLNKKVFNKIPESVKYVWSSTLPVGSAVRRDGIGKPWQVVFGTGTEGLGEWRTYVFDVRQAYRDTFGGNPPRRAEGGIGVLSDANSLDAEAFADYDDIRALRNAPPGVDSGVHQILPPLGRKNPRN